jgi:hypothetical protein
LTASFMCVSMVLATGCQSALQRRQARREVTTRVVPADSRTTLNAAIDVLQDRGFVIDKTDEATGLVHATRHSTVSLSSFRSLLHATFNGDARRSMDDGLAYEVTFVVTPRGASSTLLRALVVRSNPSGPFVEDDEAKTIYERGLYQRLFDDVIAAAERRGPDQDSGEEPEEEEKDR